MTQPALSYPASVAEPVIEILHGVPVVDPFRWLEDQENPRVREWIEGQTLYSRARLDALPRRDQIRRRVVQLLGVPVYSDVRAAGDRVFLLKREARQQQPTIYFEQDGRERLLIDPAGRDEGGYRSASIVAVSSDGRLLAYGIRRGGEDTVAVGIVDVTSGEILRDNLPGGYLRMFAFAPDGLGFYYSLESANPAAFSRRSVRYHRLNSSMDDDREIIAIGAEGRPRLVSWLADSGRFMVHMVFHSGPPIERTVYYHNLTDLQPARVLSGNAPAGFTPILAGERLFSKDNYHAANGRIVEIGIREGVADSVRVVVPEGPTRIEQARIVGDRLLILDTVSVAHRVRVYDLDGIRLADLPLPGQGTVRFFPPSPGGLFVQYSSIDTPPAIYRYDPASGNLLLWRSPAPRGKLPKLEVFRTHYTSGDGTEIPMTLFKKAGSTSSGRVPTVLNGYGGFGVSSTPEFTVLHTLLAEWGCVIAVPNIRGGSELGSAWHEAAKRRRRQTAFDDFIAAAEWLIAENRTSSDRLGMIGGSNGGLLVGAALTQRPELFRAAVSIGPLLDMLRYHRFGHAHAWTEEYGTADDPEDFAVLRSYSPYHRVCDGVRYPATLLISGDADRRCDSAHARKMTARLQQASSSGRPVLLDYSSARDHSPALPLAHRVESLTDRLAFLCEQLGVEAGS